MSHSSQEAQTAPVTETSVPANLVAEVEAALQTVVDEGIAALDEAFEGGKLEVSEELADPCSATYKRDVGSDQEMFTVIRL